MAWGAGADKYNYHTADAGTQAEMERELHEAGGLAQDPRCAAVVDTLNLQIDAASWGLGYVELDGDTYQPSADGDPPFIVAAEAAGELVDR